MEGESHVEDEEDHCIASKADNGTKANSARSYSGENQSPLKYDKYDHPCRSPTMAEKCRGPVRRVVVNRLVFTII